LELAIVHMYYVLHIHMYGRTVRLALLG